MLEWGGWAGAGGGGFGDWRGDSKRSILGEVVQPRFTKNK